MALVKFLKPYQVYKANEVAGYSQADADALVAAGVAAAVSEAEWLAMSAPETQVAGPEVKEPEPAAEKPEVKPTQKYKR